MPEPSGSLPEGHPGPAQPGLERLQLLEATASANIDGVTISDVTEPDAPLVYVNRGFEHMTGYTAGEVIGRNCRFLQGKDRDETVLAKIRAALRSNEPCRVTLRNYRKDETLFWNELTMYPLQEEGGKVSHFVGIQRDVTERTRMEAQFLQAQRLDSIGSLVGGIAHDLGNLLMPVLIGARRLQKQYPDDERTQRILAMIEQSGERGADLIKQVLSFARGVDGDRAPIKPSAIIAGVEKIIRETFPKSITLSVDVAEDCRPILGDATQLQQILMNLCVNARDAMPDGGRLTIRCKNITLDKAASSRNLQAKPGAFVLLTVRDTGTGIAPDVLDKVFEPFFTTKTRGTGTGLGLSTVYTIVKSHDGFVEARSEVESGTTFDIYLPAAS